MAKFNVNYNGLRKRETYDEIIDYLRGKQEVIKYPDRFAKRIREHPYLTQLDGEGLADMEEQQSEAMKEEVREHRVRQLASSSTQTPQEIRATQRHSDTQTEHPDVKMDDFMDDINDHVSEMEANKKRRQSTMMAEVTSQLTSLTFPSESNVVSWIHKASMPQTFSMATPRDNRSRSPMLRPKKDEKPLKMEEDAFGTKREGSEPASSSNKRPNTREIKTTPQPKATPKARARSTSDDVTVSGVSMNKSTDMNYWRQQSANELRAQITLRQGRRADWAVKNRDQLIELIKKMIAEGRW